jgi:hypothetical protein
MYRYAEPLALDPYGPIGSDPIEAPPSLAGPLEIEPFSPVAPSGEGHDEEGTTEEEGTT